MSEFRGVNPLKRIVAYAAGCFRAMPFFASLLYGKPVFRPLAERSIRIGNEC